MLPAVSYAAFCIFHRKSDMILYSRMLMQFLSHHSKHRHLKMQGQRGPHQQLHMRLVHRQDMDLDTSSC